MSYGKCSNVHTVHITVELEQGLANWPVGHIQPAACWGGAEG